MNLLHSAIQTDERFVIHGVDWETYEKFLTAVGDRHLFLTYDGEDLEFMSPSPFHERCSVRLGRLVTIVAEELDIPILSLRCTTWRRKKVKRGLEADDCFYIQNVQAVVGKTEIDLNRDPPPDLAIEIDVTHSSLDRQSIYARLGVGEIWRWNDDALRIYQLTANGEYVVRDRRPNFPFLEAHRIAELLQQCATLDDTSAGKLVRAWVREQLAKPADLQRKAGKREKKPKR